MAQGTPVALADSTALPEIGGEAGWYFNPNDEGSITATLRSLLDDSNERSRRALVVGTLTRGAAEPVRRSCLECGGSGHAH